MIKELRFETSKGKFFMVENTPEVLRQVPHDFCDRIGLLSVLTEDQAREIVDDPHYMEILSAKLGPFFTDYSNEGKSMMSAKYSLDTLIKSKGWYVNQNPVQGSIKNLSEEEQAYRQIDADWLEAERKTLFNPVIFKIN